MKNLILLCFAVLFCSTLFAQNTITVNAHISNYDGSPAQGKYISLATDSTAFFNYWDGQYSDLEGNVTFEFIAPADAPTGDMDIYTFNSCTPANGTHTLQWTEENTTFDVNFDLCLAPCTVAFDFEESTGALSVSFVNGEAPYTYEWNIGETSSTVYPNSSGSYCVQMTDAANCNIYQCYYYNANPEGDSLCTLFIDTLVNTNLEAELTAVVTGVAPFTYQWSTGETTATIVGEPFENYCVTVTDATGCNRFDCRNVGYVPQCYFELDYDVENNQFLATSFPFNIPFTYIWSTGETNQTGVITPQVSGYYSVELQPSCNDYGNAWPHYINFAPEGQIIITDSTESTNHGATVYAIQYDEIAETLTEVDNTTAWSIEEGKTTMRYEFEDQTAGSYLLKAALQPESPYYDTHLPTYYPGVLYWNEAEEISLPDYSQYNIPNFSWALQVGENMGGPGFIGGAVSDGANLLEKTSEPMENVTIILEDADGNPVAFDYTNSDGKYKFTNLALGTYRIAIDILNYPVGEKWVTLSETETSLEDNNFSVTEEEISTSIFNEVKKPNYLVSITPNPANNAIFVDMYDETNNFISYEIIDVTGQKVMSSTANSFRNNSKIDVSQLKSGMYFLKINQKDDKTSVGKFIKN